MKRATANGEMRSTKGDNKSGRGDGNGHDRPRRPEELTGQPSIIDLLGPQMTPELSKKILLTALIALKKGDFTTRLPVDLPGMDGKIADAFNEVVELNQHMADELERLSRVVGKEGKLSHMRAHGRRDRFVERLDRFGEHADRRPGLSRQRNLSRDRRRRQGRPLANHGDGDRGPAPGRGIPAHCRAP